MYQATSLNCGLKRVVPVPSVRDPAPGIPEEVAILLLNLLLSQTDKDPALCLPQTSEAAEDLLIRAPSGQRGFEGT